MSKKPSLAEAMQHLDRAPSAQPITATVESAPKRVKAAPSRDGRVAIISYQRPEVRKQLHQMKLDLDRPSIEDLLTEALNDFFQKYGKPSIA